MVPGTCGLLSRCSWTLLKRKFHPCVMVPVTGTGSTSFEQHNLVKSNKTTLTSQSCLPTCLMSTMVEGKKEGGSDEGDQLQQYIPRRTLMFVPGHDPRKLLKIPKLGVDCAVLECEDGVAINMKEEARKNCKEALNVLQSRNVDLALRINSVSSGLIEDDLMAVIGQGLGDPVAIDRLPQTILVPKVDTVEDLNFFTEKLHKAKLGRAYTPYFLFFTESGEGLMNLKNILLQARNYSEDGHYILDGVVFGSDDFCADIGAERTKDAKELIYARQKVVAMAKAFKLQAIDMVHVDIKDQTGLQAMSEEGARMGFTGKQVIHPSQVTVVEKAFTPSPARIEWATQLIHGFEEHQQLGEGAFVFRGQMIDMPLLRQAKNVLKIVNNHVS